VRTTLHHIITRCIACNTLQHTATHCNLTFRYCHLYTNCEGGNTAYIGWYCHLYNIVGSGNIIATAIYIGCGNTLHHIAPHCTTLHHTAPHCLAMAIPTGSSTRVLQCVAVCCSVLQCVAECRSVWHHQPARPYTSHSTLINASCHITQNTYQRDMSHNTVRIWGGYD